MITLVNPPNPPNGVSIKDTMGGFGQLHPLGFELKILPLDILYVASVLRNKDFQVKVIDCLCNDWELSELILQLQRQNPGFVAIRTSTPTFAWDMSVARIIKMVTNAKVVVFGPHVAFFPEQTLKSAFIDAVVVDEPELTFLDICQRGKFDGCKGLWHKQKNYIVKNEKRGPIDNLDQLPFPAWDLIPFQRLEGTSYMRNLKPFVTALTSRGCPHGCAYCPYPVVQGRKLRVRSPESVVNELEWLANELGVKAVLFRDPEFSLQRTRVIDICEGILKRGIRLAWRCETRLENLDRDLISLMSKAGCIGLNVGIESFDKQVLQSVKRKEVSLGQAKKIVRACKKNMIDTLCFFILGLPGQTKKSALKTINYALKLKPTNMEFTVATPYPGTELRAWAQSRGFIKDDSLTAITGYKVAMRNEHMTVEEISRLQQFANEAREMQWHMVLRRLLGCFRRIGGEIKRWICFQIVRLRGYQ